MRTLLAGVGRLFSAEEETADNVEVLLEGGRIVAIGPQHTLAADQEVETYPCQGALLTAGLVDAHTHPIYLRPRLEEIAERSAGASYTDIAARGGGIGATVRETRRASWDDLEQALRRRLRRWLEDGTTTVEAKTGYWLERSGELRALELLARLRDDPRLPHLVATFLGAHALPEEFLGRRQEYVDEVARWYPAAKEAGASFADVFCDRGAFTVAETAELMGAAREAGLSHRVHADELALTGATQLAVEQNAASADHLLRIGPEEIGLLASSSTVATLCPVTALALGQPPPARALVAAGVPLALGTDHNPGTSGAESMSLIVWLAVTEFGLSVEEALTAATWGGARSLELPDVGRIARGMVADLVLWDADHEGAFGWNPGLRPLQVWRAGRACLDLPAN